MAEKFRAQLACGHVIDTNTDIPWEFWCPTCKSKQRVVINRQLTGKPIDKIPSRRWRR